jgi:hypothetical protein
MVFQAKPIDLKAWGDCMEYARTNGAKEASRKYYSLLGYSESSLYFKLRLILKKESGNIEGENDSLKSGEETNPFLVKANAKKEAYEGIKLSAKEKQLIKDIAEGKVDLEDASRVIASKAFEKLLKFPDSASFTNFIQSELLKLKRQELTDKNTWAMELVNRMFNGVLPPRICPSCGEVLVKLPVLEGEVIETEDESV